MRRTNPYYRKWLTPRPDLVTDRERAVGELRAVGTTYPEVAERLGLTVAQVAAATSSLYRKLHLRHAADLTQYAIRNGWIRMRGQRGPAPVKRPRDRR